MDTFNTMPLVIALSVMATIAAVVLLYIFILPEKKREKLPKLFKIVSDILNMKELFIEKVLRFLYILSTVACVITGVLMIFGFTHYESYYYDHTTWYGGYGILLAIVGPIVLRLAFEGVMMFILLVKNTIEINKKLKGEEKSAAVEAAPTQE